MEELIADKVFISYSWTSPEHQEWVLELANRLINDGVEVILDKWDSEEGQNLNAFMEQSVNDSTIKKVLVICDELYTKKANGYEGGVGTETVIISKEVYKDVTQTKFIPIIAERGPEGETYMPTYFGTSKYIDLSSEELYEENYEILIRNLYGKPEYKKPKLGKAPGYLLEDETEKSLNSHFALKQFQHRSEKRLKNIDTYFLDFTEVFLEDFGSFALSFAEGDNKAEKIYKTYAEMHDLRDVFVKFMEYYIRESEEIMTLNIIEFLESIYSRRRQISSDQGTFFESQFEHMKLFIHEIILFTVALLLKYKKYNQLNEIVTNHYMLSDKTLGDREGSINLFRTYPQTLEDVQPDSHGKRYISYTGELFKRRSNIERISFDSIIEADFIIALINLGHNNEDHSATWYPVTLPYFTERNPAFLKKLKTKNYYESVKEMYGVSSPDEMRSLLEEFSEMINSSSRIEFGGLYIDRHILEEIGKY